MRKKTTALMIAFLLIFQYVNFAGILKPVEAAAISTNLITKMQLTDKEKPSTVIASVYNSVYYVNPDIRVELGQVLTLNYDWELPAGHTYQKDDVFEFELPAQFEMYSGDLTERPLQGADPSVGTYKVTGKTVTLKFNEEINDGTPVSGSLSFWNYFTKQSVGNQTEVPIKFNIGDTITIPIAPKGVTSPISKKGTPDKSFNAENITWTVDVNKDLKKVNGAVVTDTIPAGLTFTPGSLKVYKMTSDTDGVLSNPILQNAPTDYQVTAPVSPDNKLQLDLGNINSVYRIVFDTAVTDITKANFKNTATLKGSNITDVSASDTITNSRGKLLEKSGTYNEAAQVIDWTIKYNFGEDTIASAVLTDLFDKGHELVPGSIKVFPVADPVAGTSGTEIPSTDYTLDYDVSSHPKNQNTKNGFKLSFNNPITGAYKITYQTKPVGNLYDDKAIKNTVYSDSKESNTVTVDVKQHFLHKTNSNANYKDRTIDWNVEINRDKYNLFGLKFEDTFVSGGLKLVPGTLVVKQNGIVVNSPFYTITYDPAGATDTTNGFKISFPDGNATYTITYTTKYDYTDGSYFSNTNFSFKNTGKLIWKETAVGSEKNQSETSTFTPNKNTQDNGYKNGSYNATDKKITWNIGINYNSKTIANAVVTDTLESVQQLVAGSIEVRKLTVNSNGSTTPGALVAPTGNYSVVLPTTANNNQWQIAFTNPISEPYLITFKTDVDGKVLGATEKTINNHAYLSGTGYTTKDLTASVTIPKAGEYVFKEGQQNDDSVNWTIYINRGQSTVDEAKIYDVPSKKQTLVKESFKLYLTSVNSNGNVTKTGSAISPTDPVHGYKLTFKENTDSAISSDETFELSFNNEISKPYILEYQSIIDAKDKETISNTVTFTGAGGISKPVDNATEVKIALSGGEGTGSIYKGDLKVVKVDKDDPTLKLSGAVFELTRNSTGGVIVPSKNANGELEYNGLRYGKYTLKEKSAPAGYAIDGTGIYEVTINSTTVPVVKEIKNAKLLGSLEVTKVDSANAATVLAGATFELFNSANVSQGTQTTAANGKATFTGLPYGSYVLKEVSAPAGYSIIGNGEVNVTINASVVTKQVGNTKLFGTLEVTKVDSADPAIVLSGATFELFNSANVSLGQKTTDTSGKLSFTGLSYGTYVLKEVSAPADYKIMGSGEVNVTINAAVVSEKVKNEKLEGSLEVTKVDNDHTSTVLAGATFELFNSANVSMGKQTTDANGKAIFTALPYGSYVLKEISAPYGYSIIGNGEVNVTINASTVSKEVKNIQLLGTLELTKVDNDNTAVVLAGATFELFNSANVSLGKKTTDSTGKLSFTGLPYGSYVLKEISAPVNYGIIGNGELSVVINAPTVTKEVKNAKLLGTLEVTKVDNDNTTVVLAGATFELFNSANVSLGKQTTSSSGKISFTDLPYGSYVLKEISAPSGYSMIGNGEVNVTINAPAVSKEIKNTRDPLGRLEVTKVDSANTTIVLAGATFELYSTSNVSYGKQTTAANGKVSFTGLPLGSYVLKEISAPAGYSIIGSGEVSVTINSISGNSVTVKNNKVIVPTPTPTIAPTPTPKPTITPKPTTTPVATPAPTTSTEKEVTEVDKPVEGEVEVPDGSVPVGGVKPDHGKVVITPDGKWVYTPDPGFKGKDTFSIIVKDKDGNEEEIFFEIDVEEPPRGGITTPDVPVLPKTGENSYLLMQLLGLAMIVVGVSTIVVKRRTRR